MECGTVVEVRLVDQIYLARLGLRMVETCLLATKARVLVVQMMIGEENEGLGWVLSGRENLMSAHEARLLRLCK